MKKKMRFFSMLLLLFSICFITDVHALETPQTENSETDIVSRWEAETPETKVTSEGLIIDYDIVVEETMREMNCTATVTITIPEDYELDHIVIAPDVFTEIAQAIHGEDQDNLEMSNSIQAGDHITIHFVINNKSKYTYNYDETSFEIFPKEDIVYDQISEEPITPGDTPLFDGTTTNENYHFYRTYNTALKALIPNASSKAMTDERIGEALIARGYAGGMADYTQYLLDFYNEKYGTDYTRLDQFPDGIIREMLGENDPYLILNDAYRKAGVTFVDRTDTAEDILAQINSKTGGNYLSIEEYVVAYYNEQYGTNVTRLVDLPDEALDNFFESQGSEEGGDYNLETNADVIALSYDYFYNKGLAFGFEEDEYTHDDSEDLAIGEYMRDPEKGDASIIAGAGTLEKETEGYQFTGNLYTSGNYILNAYLGYEFNLNLQFSYSALKGTVIAQYVDVYGNVLSPDIITTDMVGRTYQTLAKEFDGYTLLTINGEETGTYIDGEIVVIYVYAPGNPGTGSTSGEEITPPETGVKTEQQGIYVTLMLLLGSAYLYRKTSKLETSKVQF